MPDIHHGIAMGRKRLPKVITPKLHAILDYAAAGTFFAMGALYWRTHRRAAISSLALGAVTTASNLMTDYPGGVWRKMSLETHDRVGAGLAGVTATVPKALGFGDDAQSRFFRIAAFGEAAILSMTEHGPEHGEAA